jgi:hypothetical protein
MKARMTNPLFYGIVKKWEDKHEKIKHYDHYPMYVDNCVVLIPRMSAVVTFCAYSGTGSRK